jgi:hypothetical protein
MCVCMCVGGVGVWCGKALWFVFQRFMCWKLGLQCGSAEVAEPVRGGVWWKVAAYGGSTLIDRLMELVKTHRNGLALIRADCYKVRSWL